MDLIIKKIENYFLFENSYICFYQNKKDCFIVDPGFKNLALLDELNNSNLNVISILLTHGHFDHILFANELREKFNCPIYISKYDQELCEDAEKNMATSFFIKKENTLCNTVTFPESNLLQILNENIIILPCPGHTLGGVSFYLKERHVVFTGDTLMKNNFGRTDLYGANFSALKTSILNTLFVLPQNTIIYPGHGPNSTIEEELKSNPIINAKKKG